MTRLLHGTVRGKTIELEEDLGVADGQQVEVQVRIRNPKKKPPGPPGVATRRRQYDGRPVGRVVDGG